jgi:hypothetical protein
MLYGIIHQISVNEDHIPPELQKVLYNKADQLGELILKVNMMWFEFEVDYKWK